MRCICGYNKLEFMSPSKGNDVWKVSWLECLPPSDVYIQRRRSHCLLPGSGQYSCPMNQYLRAADYHLCNLLVDDWASKRPATDADHSSHAKVDRHSSHQHRKKRSQSRSAQLETYNQPSSKLPRNLLTTTGTRG